MIKFFGEQKVGAYIKLWIINLNENLNLKRPLKEHQIDETANLIVSEFRHVTIADINLIFKTAKMGGYGEFYESLSIDKILTWFKDYFKERCEVAAAESRREAEAHKYRADKVQRVQTAENAEFNNFHKQYLIDQLKDGNNKGGVL